MSTERSILAVRGLEQTSDGFRSELMSMAERNGWDVDALATVMSLESGFHPDAMNPQGSAVGILQFIESTLQALGWKGTRQDFASLSAENQLPYVERFYDGAEKLGRLARPVDYYVAAWGERAGLPLEHVLASSTGDEKSQRLYRLNAQLDNDGSGNITVADLQRAVDARMATANGKRLGVSARRSIGIFVLGGIAAVAAVKWVSKRRGERRRREKEGAA